MHNNDFDSFRLKGSRFFLICSIILFVMCLGCILIVTFKTDAIDGFYFFCLVLFVFLFGGTGTWGLFQHLHTWLAVSQDTITYYPMFKKHQQYTFDDIGRIQKLSIRDGDILRGYSKNGERLFWVRSQINGYSLFEKRLREHGLSF